jgi:hypothetical protein
MTDLNVMALATQIASGSDKSNLQTRGWIRTIHRLPDGAEALRLIVRDDLAGCSQIIADSLWDNL